MSKTTQMVSTVMAIAMTIAIAIPGANATDIPVQEHVVVITGLAFVPDTIRANPGDTITWVNRDIVPHTATGRDGSWDTGLIDRNESKSVIVSRNMTSDYFCRFHVNMTGTVEKSNGK